MGVRGREHESDVVTSVDPVPPEGRIVMLLLSPRTGPGLLTWTAWLHLRAADAVLGLGFEPAWERALSEAGVRFHDLGQAAPREGAARLLKEVEGGRCAVWFGSPDGDPGLTEALAEQLSHRSVAGAPPEVEIVTGSYDLPGSRVLDLISVMDQLRSPGGCPWDAQQTHESLLRYLLEETHEVIEAVESGNRTHLREELGDLLLQVIFHARVAEEHSQDPFGLDDVAGGIVEKLIRRHPHVFADEEAAGPDDVLRSWEQRKAREKGRTDPFAGIPATMPALARGQKMLERLERTVGLPVEEVERVALAASGGDAVAEALVRALLLARGADVDAESVLRARLGELERARGTVGGGEAGGDGTRPSEITRP
jgi:XTP/dITP diphosphohydrolase